MATNPAAPLAELTKAKVLAPVVGSATSSGIDAPDLERHQLVPLVDDPPSRLK
jgi:hypothetical protein